MDIKVSQASAGIGRRHLLGAGLGGAALSLLPLLGGRAHASTGSTTTAPPQQPTDDDVALLGAAQQVELSLLALYDIALAGVTTWDDAQLAVVTALRESHQEYANTLSALLGRQAPNTPSEAIIDELSGGFTGNREDVFVAMHGAESAAVATHGELLGLLQGINGAGVIASVQMAEARHCTVLADLAGIDELELLLVDEEAAPLQVNG